MKRTLATIATLLLSSTVALATSVYATDRICQTIGDYGEAPTLFELTDGDGVTVSGHEWGCDLTNVIERADDVYFDAACASEGYEYTTGVAVTFNKDGDLFATFGLPDDAVKTVYQMKRCN